MRYTLAAARQALWWDAVAHYRSAQELLHLMPTMDQSTEEAINQEEDEVWDSAMDDDLFDHYGLKLKACMTPEEYKNACERERNLKEEYG